MDKGTDAREILENRLLPLRRGVLALCGCVETASGNQYTKEPVRED